MRRTAFILGSGLLLLVAFWNSVTWHLQRFWGASGHFWQAQWEKLLLTYEGKEWILFVTGATYMPVLSFWTINGLLLVVDTTGKPNFIFRYRIQLGKNEPEEVILRSDHAPASFQEKTSISDDLPRNRADHLHSQALCPAPHSAGRMAGKSALDPGH